MAGPDTRETSGAGPITVTLAAPSRCPTRTARPWSIVAGDTVLAVDGDRVEGFAELVARIGTHSRRHGPLTVRGNGTDARAPGTADRTVVVTLDRTATTP